MGDGWENARRRGPGNDFVAFRLAAAGRLRHVEIDTSYFVGNAPGWIELSGASGAGEDDLAWWPVLARTRVQPDTRHRFLVATGRGDAPPARRLPRRWSGQVPRPR